MGQSRRVLTTAILCSSKGALFWKSTCFYLSLEDDSSRHLKATVNQLLNLITNCLPFMHALLASPMLSCSVNVIEFTDKLELLPLGCS